MLKKAHRLKSRRDFNRALSSRRLWVNDCFALYGFSGGSPSSDTNRSRQLRIGFIVSKKVHKRSVRRNRIKRRLRELVRTVLFGVFRERMAEYRVLVFIARQGTLECPFSELKRKMEQCLDSLSSRRGPC